MTQNGVTTTYTYDDNNRLESETVAGVATTYTDFSVIQECDGSYTVSMTKPGDVPGSYAVYTKTVSASGDTTSLTQIAYDKNGEIVRYHDKFNE